MPVIRIVFLVLVVGGLTLFGLSNLSPISLVFLGMKTVELPLAVWVGGAIAAGAITSFCLQLLSSVPRGYSTQGFERPSDLPPRTRSFTREAPEKPTSEPQTRYTSPPPKTPTNSATSDWEESVDEDWSFDEESAAPASSQRDFDREQSRSSERVDRSSYEAKQEPKTHSQSGSVYSYSYREPSESGVGKAEAVYDANYRVITPPYEKAVEPEEDDEEDWGFEDDEEFDDGEDQRRRR